MSLNAYRRIPQIPDTDYAVILKLRRHPERSEGPMHFARALQGP